jgi:photosystem II stability/assembly factor-like uncharacterized protein
MTEDGGKSWIRTIWLDRGSIRALAHYEDAIYAAGSKAYELESGYTASQLAIYLSTDDGRTWQSLATPDGASGAADMAIGRDGPLLVGTASGVWQFTRRR